MPPEKVVVVTGANTGLGFAVVRRLCQHYGDKAVVYLTARDEARGQIAVAQLGAEGLRPTYHYLDVTKDASVVDFVRYLRDVHGGVDIVISNAAARIAPDRPQAEQVETFINTNNHGTHRMIQAFRPLLNDGARFIIVASSFGRLQYLDPSLHAKFDIAQSTLEGIERVMDDYAGAVVRGEAVQQGWPEWINIPSKIGQVASMKIFAREMAEAARSRRILINAVCPGLVDTEASRPWFKDMSAAKSPDEAAVDVVWLATLREIETQPYGELVQYRRILSFDERASTP